MDFSRPVLVDGPLFSKPARFAWFREKFEELFSIDLRSLAAFRIGLALLILWDLVEWSMNLEPFFSPSGLMPNTVLLQGYGTDLDLSIHLLAGSIGVMSALLVIAGAFALASLVGYRTQLVTFVSWLFLLSLHARQFLLLNGGDHLLGILLFIGIFLPLGSKWSVDSLLDPRAAKKPERVFSLASFTVLFQVLLVYLFTTILKLGYPEWQDGSAVYYALRSDLYTKPLGAFLLGYPKVVKFLTYLVVGYEGIGALLLFMPFWTARLRFAAVVGFLVMQACFGLCLEVRLFPWVTGVAMLLFLPGSFWETLARPFLFLSRSAGSLASVLIQTFKLKPKALKAEPLPLNGTKHTWACPTILGIFLLYALLSNLEDVAGKEVVPAPLQWLGDKLQLWQDWGMFAPPGNESWWLVVPGTLANGREIDLLKGGGRVDWERPRLVSALYKNDFWRTYASLLMTTDDGWWFLPEFSRYQCEHWNKTHSGGEELKKLRIFFISQEIQKDLQLTPPQKELLMAHECGS